MAISFAPRLADSPDRVIVRAQRRGPRLRFIAEPEGDESMRSPPGRLDVVPAADPEALRRWGVADCGRIDHRALTRSLGRLRGAETGSFTDATRVVRHIRLRYHGTLVGWIEDAVALSIACESAHGASDRWPHGLSDRLVDILEALEHHQHREDAVVFPRLLARPPGGVEPVVALMEAEHAAIRDRLDRLLAITRDLALPEGACAKWRVLYVLCRQVDSDARALMALEEHDLFPQALRDRTEAGVCAVATSL
jgi:regulator of cell morphogenesis and NO signaling